MIIKRADLTGCGAETDTVVVIDVLRAFTTAAAAFASGAERILPVGEIDEAFKLRSEFPGSITMGEDGGLPIPGFDFSNSPNQFNGTDLKGKTIIQRTTNGTQGIVRSRNAKTILAASLCCASATVRLIQKLKPQSLTLVETGRFDGGWGGEDVACADLIELKIDGHPVSMNAIRLKAANSRTAMPFHDPADTNHAHEDFEFALEIDKYSFTMQVFSINGFKVIKKVEFPFI